MTARIQTIGSGFQGLLDTIANYLSTAPIFPNQPDTTVVHWVVGDIGMGGIPGLPVGFISPLNDEITPYGRGGSTGGPHGTDMDQYTIPMLIIQAEHNQEDAVQAQGLDFYEMPGYRGLIQLMEDVRKALRAEPTMGGVVAATTTISEARPMLINLDNKIYRGARMTLTARARVSRG